MTKEGGDVDSQSLISISAALYTFDAPSNQWVGIDGGLSTVNILKDRLSRFWLSAVSVADTTIPPLKVLIHKDAKYQKQTATYHCLHLGASNFYGFNFSDFESANNFASVIKESLEVILGLPDSNHVKLEKVADISRPPPPKPKNPPPDAPQRTSSGSLVKKKDSRSSLIKSSSPKLSRRNQPSPRLSLKPWNGDSCKDQFSRIMSLINHIAIEQQFLKTKMEDIKKLVDIDGVKSKAV